MMMVSKQSSQVWLLLIFAVLAFCSYNTERVSANEYCPAGNLEHVWTTISCAYSRDYKNCPQWCQDRGKTFNKKHSEIVYPPSLMHGEKCFCCCQEPEPVPPPPPNNNKWCPPGDIERISVTNICGFNKDYMNCENWCRHQGRSFTRNKFKKPDSDQIDCVCCCGDALPPPSSTGSSLFIAAN